MTSNNKNKKHIIIYYISPKQYIEGITTLKFLKFNKKLRKIKRSKDSINLEKFNDI